MNNIEIIARGFIIHEDKVLLCKVKTKPHWFFPGGHMETGETIEEAFRRELREEINKEIKDIEFIGVAENTFSDPEGGHQEVNVVFSAELKDVSVSCQENHLEFGWFSLDKISEINIKPESLKEQFLKWLEDKEVFYIK